MHSLCRCVRPHVHTESEALLMAIQTLRQDGIPSLPIHDSLLIGITVPNAAEMGIAALQKAWAAHHAQWVKVEEKAASRVIAPS